MQINENIKQARISARLSQQKLADLIGEKRSTYAGWEQNIMPQADILAKISSVLKVSMDDLLSNTAKEFLLQEPEIDYLKKRRDQKNGDSKDEWIIYVPITAQAGYSQRIKDPQFEKSFEKVYIPGLKYKGAKYRIFEVEGDSMSKTLEEGMQVIAENVDQESWSSIANYYIYVLVSDDMITIKRIFRKSVDEWVLISDNEEFYDQVVFKISNLKELWKVKRKLDWDLAPPKKFEIKV